MIGFGYNAHYPIQYLCTGSTGTVEAAAVIWLFVTHDMTRHKTSTLPDCHKHFSSRDFCIPLKRLQVYATYLLLHSGSKMFWPGSDTMYKTKSLHTCKRYWTSDAVGKGMHNSGNWPNQSLGFLSFNQSFCHSSLSLSSSLRWSSTGQSPTMPTFTPVGRSPLVSSWHFHLSSASPSMLGSALCAQKGTHCYR